MEKSNPSRKITQQLEQNNEGVTDTDTSLTTLNPLI